jgi:ferredoxin-NADP reductase/MOSC domain-containing protein YiiM
VIADQPAGRLMSVNVGLPKDVSWRGRRVHTAVWKRPVNGPRLVRRLNIDGDGQGDLAGHGGEHRAVFVYQIESYRYWQEQLGRDDFEYGQFGENFTVEGLADDQVCIGDRYRIGEAIFEVTQPRVTCYRVGIRMDDPRMPALLVSHHRPGFYLRVIREGHVQAGDEVIRLASGPESMTVAEVDALLYLPGHPRQQVLRALRIPALPAGWRASFQAILGQTDAPGAGGNAGLTVVSPPPAWPGFRPFTVTAIERESDTVLSVHLADPEGTAVPAALPGQYLTLRLRTDEGARPLLRSYSLSGRPGAPSYRIGVKREPHGAGSHFLHSRVRAGDLLDVAAPRGTFTLQATESPVLLISAGVGATPVLAILHALGKTRSCREVWWLHGARSRAEEPFAAESRALVEALPNGHRHICYSRPGPDDVKGRDYHTTGRLTGSVLTALDLPNDADAYICGPAAFMADISATLVGMGVDAARIRTEIFGVEPALTPGIAYAPTRPPHPPAGEPSDGTLVAFARSGLTVHWDSSYASLLELAEACDVPARWSCRTGVCHTCETGVMSGRVTYAPEPVDDPAEGSALICCAQPRADTVLDL